MDKERSLVKYLSTDTKLKFGDQVEVTTTENVKFPVAIDRNMFMIETCRVNNEVPLLFSRFYHFINPDDNVLNFTNDTIFLFS